MTKREKLTGLLRWARMEGKTDAETLDALLAELRTPDEGMMTAGSNALNPWVAPAMHAGEAFTAMIDAI